MIIKTHKKFLLFILLAILHQTNFAQTNFQISSFNPTREDFKLLLLTNKEIAANDTINEKILDLVDPMLVDSVITRRKQHHKVFLVGWLIHAFGGYNWRAVDMHKEKYVGTVTSDGRSGKEEYTEYDIKFHLQFHLTKYLFKNFEAYDLQRKYHRQDFRKSHHTNYKSFPFVRDTDTFDCCNFTIGCELTPARNFRAPLNTSFFPTLPDGSNLKTHPNFGTSHPSMGFYGTSCLDCNHNCHPELHPYEWMWWLNLTNEESTKKTWLVGLFHESSNRMKNWSKNPMTGSVSIPFAYKYKAGGEKLLRIEVEHLVYNKFVDEGMKKMELPKNLISTNEENVAMLFTGSDSTQITATLHFNNIIKTDGLKYWFSDLNFDKQNNVLSGYVHFATSAKDLYTTRITFDTLEIAK